MGLFKSLNDELMLRVLGLVKAQELGALASTCKALYCFANHEELWRALTLQGFEGAFSFKGTWKATYLSLVVPGYAPPQQPPLKVRDFYSDLLYQPYFCATVPLREEWLDNNNVERRSGLSLEEFRAKYEKPNRPVIITDAVSGWSARKAWNRKALKAAFSSSEVTVGDYSMRFRDFLMYCDGNKDDMPLYLFDKNFVKKAPHLAQDYEVPEYFAEDLFALLGEKGRPDYRWLIMGPERSGSSFHKDPNGTSAWNAVILGSKKWIMFPPTVLPPGVMASEDGADVATSVSLVEWFLNFYEEAQEWCVKPQECVVKAGELLFVPRGWWHMALNLEESIAVTQNYVSSVNLPHVLKFLATGSEDLISGCPQGERATLHQRFTAVLEEHRPELVQATRKRGRSAITSGSNSLTALFQTKRPGGQGGTQKFSFGF